MRAVPPSSLPPPSSATPSTSRWDLSPSALCAPTPPPLPSDPMTVTPTARFTVVIVDHPFDDLETERRILGEIGAHLVDAQVQTEPEAIEACRHADAVLVRRFPLRRAIIERMQRCRIICNYGTGYDNVDVRAAAERGIPVSAT